jgi:hypothetical protein
MNDAVSPADLSEPHVRLLEKLCDDFERAWREALRNGMTRPRLEDSLSQLPASVRTIGLREPEIPKGWRKVGSKDNGFSVLMPGKPVVTSGAGENSYRVSLTDPSGTCAVKETIFEINVRRLAEFTKMEQDELLDSERAWIARSRRKGKVGGDKAIKLGDHVGIEFTIAGDRMVSRHQLFVVHYRALDANLGQLQP